MTFKHIGVIFAITIGVLMLAILGLMGCDSVVDSDKYFEGIFDHAEYLKGGYADGNKTIIYFADGRSVVCLGHHNMVVTKGTYIRVYNKLESDDWLEVIEEKKHDNSKSFNR